MELKCDKCGKIDRVLVDGYSVGDRLLEGVMFEVADSDGHPVAVGVTERYQAYFETLNREYWFSLIEDFCQDLDVAECPKCGDEVPVWGHDKQPAGNKIKLFSFSDIIKEAHGKSNL